MKVEDAYTLVDRVAELGDDADVDEEVWVEAVSVCIRYMMENIKPIGPFGIPQEPLGSDYSLRNATQENFSGGKEDGEVPE